ncbi:MltR family transcriptional regulator [Photobacterium sp. DNB22_13_2]
MRTESIHLPNESELLEVISQADNVSSVFSAAYHALDDTVGALMQSLFEQNDYSVKFVIEPLISNSGPLGDVLVRTKLLLGLAVINKQLYSDIETFVRLKDLAEARSDDISFTDAEVLQELRKISAIERTMPIHYDPSMLKGLSEPMLNMFIDRHNQKVHSTIVLAITDIVENLRHSRLSN